MNYYISGMTGFIGASIARYLNKKDWTNLILPVRRGQSIDELKKQFARVSPDIIIHTSAYGNHSNQNDFRQMVEANIIGTYKLLEAASSYDYKILYNVSTSSVLLNDQTMYSITKHCGEQLARMYRDVVTVRPYSVYGPGEAAHRFIPTVINCLNTGKEMVLDKTASHAWIYIDDMVRALFAGEKELGGKFVTNKEIVSILEDISGKKLKYTLGMLRGYNCADIEGPGICYTSLQEGLKKTYEYFTQKDN